VVGTVVVAALIAGTVSQILPKVYSTSSKLLIVQGGETTSFDAIQAAQVTARTYSDVLSSPNIAGLVARRIGNGVTRRDVESDVSVAPVAETQLLQITAEAGDPARAKQLADTYAAVFIGYARRALASTTRAQVTLADPAPLVRDPSRPKPLLYVLLACLLAVPLGIAAALLRERLDSRLGSPDEIEERFPLRVIARVPRRGRSDASRAVFNESFRLLRTGLRFASPDGELRMLAVTSGAEGEGKTTTSYNLARAAQETGQHVLLVEGDVYRARLLELLELTGAREGSSTGLTGYLAGACSLDEAIRPVEDGLDVLPAGPMPPSFSALLEGQRGLGLMTALASRADLIIIDCPPLAPRADAAIFAGRVDGVVLVVDLTKTTNHRLRGAMRQLQSVSANILGCVVNRDTTMQGSQYSYYASAGPGSATRLAEERDDVPSTT
jgi:capsular exopolysaccharide synthesis family protein